MRLEDALDPSGDTFLSTGNKFSIQEKKKGPANLYVTRYFMGRSRTTDELKRETSQGQELYQLSLSPNSGSSGSSFLSLIESIY